MTKRTTTLSLTAAAAVLALTGCGPSAADPQGEAVAESSFSSASGSSSPSPTLTEPSNRPTAPAPASTAAPERWEGTSPSGATIIVELDAEAPEDLASFFATMGVEDLHYATVNVEPEGGENSAKTPEIISIEGTVPVEFVVGEDQEGGIILESAPDYTEEAPITLPATGEELSKTQAYEYGEWAKALIDKYDSAETAKQLVYVTDLNFAEITSVEVDYGSDTVVLQQMG